MLMDVKGKSINMTLNQLVGSSSLPRPTRKVGVRQLKPDPFFLDLSNIFRQNQKSKKAAEGNFPPLTKGDARGIF